MHSDDLATDQRLIHEALDPENFTKPLWMLSLRVAA